MLRKIWYRLPDYMFYTVVTLVLILSSVAIWKYTNQTQLYNWKNTIVAGNSYIPDDKVRNLADMEPGESVLNLEISRIAGRLSAYPYIKCQKISRIFPSTIRIDIVEREPFALVKCKNETSLIDKDGVILPYDPEIFKSFSLPSIKGETEEVNISDLNSEENSNWVQTRVQLLKEFSESLPELFSAAYSIGVEGNQLIFYHFAGSTNIQLDLTDHEEQTEKLISFYRTVEDLRRLTDYKVIDLRTPGQVIVVENNIGKS